MMDAKHVKRKMHAIKSTAVLAIALVVIIIGMNVHVNDTMPPRAVITVPPPMTPPVVASLVPSNPAMLTTHADLLAYCDSGSGTEGDPFIIENRIWDLTSSPDYSMFFYNCHEHVTVRNSKAINTAEWGAYCYYLANSGNITLQNCSYYGSLYGSTAVAFYQCVNCTVDGCFFSPSIIDQSTGIYIYNCTGIQVMNTRVMTSQFDFYSEWPSYDCYLKNDTFDDAETQDFVIDALRNMTIVNCTFAVSTCTGHPISVTNCIGISFITCNITSIIPALDTCYVNNSATLVFDGCRFHNNSIECHYTASATVHSCHFNGSSIVIGMVGLRFAICFDSSQDSAIYGCMFINIIVPISIIGRTIYAQIADVTIHTGGQLAGIIIDHAQYINIQEIYADSIIGYNLTNSYNITISNSIIANATTSCLVIKNSTLVQFDNATIDTTLCTGYPIHVKNSTAITFKNCTFTSRLAMIKQCYFYKSNSTRFINCRVMNNSLSFNTARNLTITGCVFFSTSSIDMTANCTLVNVTGNAWWDYFSQGTTRYGWHDGSVMPAYNAPNFTDPSPYYDAALFGPAALFSVGGNMTINGVVAFMFTGSDGTAPMVFSWNFGDGSASSFENPSHVYYQNGTFLVTLTITDASGRSSTCTALVVIYSMPKIPFPVPSSISVETLFLAAMWVMIIMACIIAFYRKRH
jgi:hypothetical protein